MIRISLTERGETGARVNEDHATLRFPRFQINGYIEEGTTTTPFDLCVQNLASRYHLVMQAVRAVAGFNAEVAAQADAIAARYDEKLTEHHDYIRTHGEDMPEIANWKWG